MLLYKLKLKDQNIFLKEVSKLAVTAQIKLPVEEDKTTLLTGIKQKTDKPYKDLMGRLEALQKKCFPLQNKLRCY